MAPDHILEVSSATLPQSDKGRVARDTGRSLLDGRPAVVWRAGVLVPTCVNGSLFNETKRVSPWVLSVERRLAPWPHNYTAARRVMDVLTREAL